MRHYERMTIMSNFSCYEILKSNAKKLASTKDIKLSEAQELIAKEASFVNFHELSKVAQHSPLDQRLMKAALGVSNLKNALYENGLYDEISQQLNDRLSGEVADTNAYGFSMEDVEVTDANYDNSTGVLTLDVSLTYRGEQDPGRTYLGSAFYLEMVIYLVRHNDKWAFAKEELEIHKIESDLDRYPMVERAIAKLKNSVGKYTPNEPPKGHPQILLRIIEGAGVALHRSDEKAQAELIPPRPDFFQYTGGYSWGYSGSGCKNLSYAIVAEVFNGNDRNIIVEKASLLLKFIARLNSKKEYTFSYDYIKNKCNA